MIFYRRAVVLPKFLKKSAVENLLTRHGWSHVSTIKISSKNFSYSDNHVVVISLKGSMTLEFGDYSGQCIRIQKSDAIIIPAGVAYRILSIQEKPRYITAQPAGPARAIHLDVSSERPERPHIDGLPIPLMDPIYRVPGALYRLWTPAQGVNEVVMDN